MRVKLETTITTFIELNSGASVEEARKEIFNRFNTRLEEDEIVQELLSYQSDAVIFDTVVDTQVSHTFGEANE